MEVDARVRRKIADARREDSVGWINPIIHVSSDEKNPFLPPDHQEKSGELAVHDSVRHRLFTDTCRHMCINLTCIADVDRVAPACARFKDFSLDLEPQMATGLAKRSKLLTVEFSELKTEMECLEPVICTLFLVNKKEGSVITDHCNIVAPRSGQYFERANIPFSDERRVSFQVDPSAIDMWDTMIVLLLSHPVSTDDGAAMQKYYLNPNAGNLVAAKKASKNAFAKSNAYWMTFAWATARFPRGDGDVVVFPDPYVVTEKSLASLTETDICKLERERAKFKQMPMRFQVKKVEGPSKLVLRPLGNVKPGPFAAPVHQMSVRIVGVEVGDLPMQDIVVNVAVREKGSKYGSRCIRGKYNGCNCRENESSRSLQRGKLVRFDDRLLLDLPWPVTDDLCLTFSVYKVQTRFTKDATLVLVMSGDLRLKYNSHLLPDNTHKVTMSHVGKNDSQKGVLTVATFVRSSMITTSECMEVFLSNLAGEVPCDELVCDVAEIPGDVLISNLMVILDAMLMRFTRRKSSFSLPLLVALANRVSRERDDSDLYNFLLIFVEFFACRSEIADSLRHRQRQRWLERSLPSRRVKKANTTISRHGLASSSRSIKISQDDTDVSAAKPEDIEEDDEKELHIKILNALMVHLKTEENSMDQIVNLLPFLFSLVSKYMIIMETIDLDHAFVEQFAESFAVAASRSQHIARASSSFAFFVNALFDINMASSAVVANNVYIRTIGDDAVGHYVRCAFLPSFFFFCLNIIAEFGQSVCDILKEAFVRKERLPVVSHILVLVGCYNDQQRKIVASRLLGALDNGGRLKIADMAPIDEVQPVIKMFYFLLSHCSDESLLAAVRAKYMSGIVDIVHYLLHVGVKIRNGKSQTVNERRKVLKAKFGTLRAVRKVPEQSTKTIPAIMRPVSIELVINTTDLVMSVFVFIEAFLKIADVVGARMIIGIVYHLMITEIDEAYYPRLFGKNGILCSCLEKSETYEADKTSKRCSLCIGMKSPCLVKVIYRLIMLSLNKPDHASYLATAVEVMFRMEYENTGNNLYSTVICTRAFSLIDHPQFLLDQYATFVNVFKLSNNTDVFGIWKLFNRLMSGSARRGNPTLCNTQRAEMLLDSLYELVEVRDSHYILNMQGGAFARSPDAQIDVLNQLRAYHNEETNALEIVHILMFQACIVYDVLQKMKVTPNFYVSQRGVAADLSLQEFVKTRLGIVVDIDIAAYAIPSFCDSKYFCESGLVSFISEALEISARTNYTEQCCAIADILRPIFEHRRRFGHLASLMRTVADTAGRARDVQADHYVMVEFKGDIFQDDSGKKFIYRTRIDADTMKKDIISRYTDLYGPDTVMDSSVASPEQSSVEVTVVDTETNAISHRRFVFGTTDESGTITRTFLEVVVPLPGLIERSEVIRTEEEQIPPVTAFIERISYLVEQIEVAASFHSGLLLNGLLQEAMSTTMCMNAEQFISTHRETLAPAFKALLNAVSHGLVAHARHVTNAPEDALIHAELESGFDSMTTRISFLLSVQ